MPPPIVRAALGLGANLGDKCAALQRAVDIISADVQVWPVAVSPIFETPPIGGPAQPNFYNAVLVVETSLHPTELLALAHKAEQALNRTRGVRWAARTLDVDLLAYGDIVSDDPELTLPHPRAAERGFVLVPWSQIDPDFVVIDNQSVSQLRGSLSLTDADAIRVVDGELLELRSSPTLES